MCRFRLFVFLLKIRVQHSDESDFLQNFTLVKPKNKVTAVEQSYRCMKTAVFWYVTPSSLRELIVQTFQRILHLPLRHRQQGLLTHRRASVTLYGVTFQKTKHYSVLTNDRSVYKLGSWQTLCFPYVNKHRLFSEISQIKKMPKWHVFCCSYRRSLFRHRHRE